MHIDWRKSSMQGKIPEAGVNKIKAELARLLRNVEGVLSVSCIKKVHGSPHHKDVVQLGVYDLANGILKITYQFWGNDSRYEFGLKPPAHITLDGLRAVLRVALAEERSFISKKPKKRKPLPEMVRPTPAPVAVPDIKALRAEVLEPKPTSLTDVLEQKTVVVVGQGLFDHTTPVLTYLCALVRAHERPVLTVKATMDLITMYFNGNEEVASRFMWFLGATGHLGVGARQVTIPKDIYALYR